MGIALGDLLQITDFQDYLGEQVLNVYYYRWFSAPVLDNSAYEPLLDSFVDQVVQLVRIPQSGLLTHETAQIKNLSNGLDFAEIEVDVIGNQAATIADAMPSYVSYGFQLVHDSLATRSGYKRFAGVFEPLVSGNDYIGSPTTMDNIEGALNADLSIGLIAVASPIIPKRPLVPPMGTSYVYSSVASAIFKGMGTQNTRKQGRGA